MSLCDECVAVPLVSLIDFLGWVGVMLGLVRVRRRLEGLEE